ncbi:hypothetical protein ACWGDE_21450 [Streptomyces sp. NPDC054956]
MATLGELFDVAVAHLREVARTPLASVPPGERAALADEVDGLLLQVQKGLGPRAYTPTPAADEDQRRRRELTQAEQNLEDCLGDARTLLGTASRYLAPQAGQRGPSGERIASAARAVGAVRDVIGSHLGPDRAPLTPYAYLLRHQKAFDYLARRYSEVAWEAGHVVHRLAQGVEHPGAVDAFERAKTSLDHASVYARAATRDADHDLASFPAALPVEPVHASATDPTSAVTARLAEDCERLSRAAYTALHDTAEHRLSGSDLQQISSWNALGRMLAGRTLMHVLAGDMADGAVQENLKSAAMALRGASKAWGAAANAWGVVVDTGDPREHPPLELPRYAQVRRGQVAKMPSTEPHPAVVISRTATVRIGQLLFGSEWTPDQPPGAAGRGHRRGRRGSGGAGCDGVPALRHGLADGGYRSVGRRAGQGRPGDQRRRLPASFGWQGPALLPGAPASGRVAEGGLRHSDGGGAEGRGRSPVRRAEYGHAGAPGDAGRGGPSVDRPGAEVGPDETGAGSTAGAAARVRSHGPGDRAPSGTTTVRPLAALAGETGDGRPPPGGRHTDRRRRPTRRRRPR